MVLESTGQIEGVGGNDYQRLYLPTQLSSDSSWPFSAGDNVRMEVVETTCERGVLVVCSDQVEVDTALTDLELQRSTREVQTSLEELAEGEQA